MLTLRQKQSIFVRSVCRLIARAEELGYELTFGEAYRSPEEAKRLAALGTGISASLHTKRLAIDLNLFRNGAYLSSTKAHEPLGVFWESLSSGEIICAWGGRFEGRRKDGNHYSIEHEGVR